MSDEERETVKLERVYFEKPEDKRLINLYVAYEEMMTWGIELLSYKERINTRLDEGGSDERIEKFLGDFTNRTREAGIKLIKKALIGLHKARDIVRVRRSGSYATALELVKARDYLDHIIIKYTTLIETKGISLSDMGIKTVY